MVLGAALTLGAAQHSRFVSFAIPLAVKNVLALDMSDELDLIEGPGIKQPDGRCYFSPSAVLELRFANASRLDGTLESDIDSFSRIALEGNKYVLSTTFVPNQPLSEVVEISFAAPLA